MSDVFLRMPLFWIIARSDNVRSRGVEVQARVQRALAIARIQAREPTCRAGHCIGLADVHPDHPVVDIFTQRLPGSHLDVQLAALHKPDVAYTGLVRRTVVLTKSVEPVAEDRARISIQRGANCSKLHCLAAHTLTDASVQNLLESNCRYATAIFKVRDVLAIWGFAGARPCVSLTLLESVCRGVFAEEVRTRVVQRSW